MTQKEPKKTGRPESITKDMVQELLDCFADGLSDREACNFLGIPYSTFTRYCARHATFRNQKEMLKNTPLVKAKRLLARDIAQGSVDTAKWVLERKDPEYKKTQDISLTTQACLSIEDARETAKEILKRYTEE